MTDETETPSYHDVHVTTATIPRTSIFDLPYGYELTCNRVGGWTLWGPMKETKEERGDWMFIRTVTGPPKLAEEYCGKGKGLIIDVAGHVVCDSLTKREGDDER